MPTTKKISSRPITHAPRRSGQPKKGFEAIMSETTRHMPRYQRLFSRFIHAEIIFFIGALLSRTIARPNALLVGALFSFTATLITYLFAKNLGYNLTGFEAISAFTVGWAIGLVLDLIIFVTRKR